MSGKLRSIYDALDHGNYKSAMKLCSSFLQKQPGHALCRALHAVALERNGRVDEAIQLCGETASAGASAAPGSPASLDDTCLNTLQVVLRRCRQWSAIESMYEAAAQREPENKEFVSCLFFASIRRGNFSKAQQVATKVYSKFKEPHFLQWVIASILLQVRDGGPPKILDLAAMMLQKAPVNTAALKSDEDIPFDRGQLYLLMLHLSTLQMQQKQEKALELLEAARPLVKLPSDFAALRVQLLYEADRLKEAVQEARAQIIASPGSWLAVQDFARLVMDLAPPENVDVSKGHSHRFRSGAAELPSVTSLEEVDQHGTADEAWNALLLLRHFQQGQETSSSAGGVVRVAFMGELELQRAAMARSELDSLAPPSREHFEDMVRVMETFMRRFATRAHCFFDLKPYLDFLPDEHLASLLALAEELAEGREAVILAARLRRACKRLEAAAEASEASALLESWASFGGVSKEKPGPEALLQLAVVSLLELDRTGCLAGKARDRRYILDGIALARLGLEDQPHAFGFKVLLILLYSALGLPSLMMSVFETMDIKNIQHESLSHLVFDLLRGGNAESLREVCHNIVGFHEDMDKDGGEALAAAFLKCVLPRAIEYVDSISQANKSLMWGRAVAEEAVLELATAGTWEAVLESLSRQARMVDSVAEKPTEYWVSRTQDRALLNGLQRLPSTTAAGGMLEVGKTAGEVRKLRSRPRSVSSFALAWHLPPSPSSSAPRAPQLRRGEQGAADELLHGGLEGSPAAQLRFSSSLLQLLGALAPARNATGGLPAEETLAAPLEAARAALAELCSSSGSEVPSSCSNLPAAAARLAAEESVCLSASCWSSVCAKFRCLACSLGLAAGEIPELLLRCVNGKEAWEKLAERLESLGACAQQLANSLAPSQASLDDGKAADGSFNPPSRTECSRRPFAVGCFGLPWLSAFLSDSLAFLIPVLLWCMTSLPKAPKKPKEGQEGLQTSRQALKTCLQAVQAGLSNVQAELAGAAPAQVADLWSSREPVELPEVSALVGSACPEGFVRLRAEAECQLLEAHRKQLSTMHEALGQRLVLLKSRGAFKP
eukprot:TRINITY_DN35243_c0_g1_i1.p1 TRINITY_DN35243_c0_g1~~TRINITY_DN35243_c0_g1_i1.p1  ORF type:complete len:1067 (-),score=254.97 TRINITY_DN35243_c0_g1_i1:13-3213(-)